MTHRPRTPSELRTFMKSKIALGFRAGERHWLAAGRLLNEAHTHFPESGPNDEGLTFGKWVAANFVDPWTKEPMAERQAQQLMLAARQSAARAKKWLVAIDSELAELDAGKGGAS